MKCSDLWKDTLRITGVHFSDNKTKQDEKIFLEIITKIQNVLKIWRMGSLVFIVFKILFISKIVYLSIMIKVPTEIIVELEQIQKWFISPTKPKFENGTILSDFNDGGLKNVEYK